MRRANVVGRIRQSNWPTKISYKSKLFTATLPADVNGRRLDLRNPELYTHEQLSFLLPKRDEIVFTRVSDGADASSGANGGVDVQADEEEPDVPESPDMIANQANQEQQQDMNDGLLPRKRVRVEQQEEVHLPGVEEQEERVISPDEGVVRKRGRGRPPKRDKRSFLSPDAVTNFFWGELDAVDNGGGDADGEFEEQVVKIAKICKLSLSQTDKRFIKEFISRSCLQKPDLESSFMSWIHSRYPEHTWLNLHSWEKLNGEDMHRIYGNLELRTCPDLVDHMGQLQDALLMNPMRKSGQLYVGIKHWLVRLYSELGRDSGFKLLVDLTDELEM